MRLLGRSSTRTNENTGPTQRSSWAPSHAVARLDKVTVDIKKIITRRRVHVIDEQETRPTGTDGHCTLPPSIMTRCEVRRRPAPVLLKNTISLSQKPHGQTCRGALQGLGSSAPGSEKDLTSTFLVCTTISRLWTTDASTTYCLVSNEYSLWLHCLSKSPNVVYRLPTASLSWSSGGRLGHRRQEHSK